MRVTSVHHGMDRHGVSMVIISVRYSAGVLLSTIMGGLGGGVNAQEIHKDQSLVQRFTPAGSQICITLSYWLDHKISCVSIGQFLCVSFGQIVRLYVFGFFNIYSI